MQKNKLNVQQKLTIGAATSALAIGLGVVGGVQFRKEYQAHVEHEKQIDIMIRKYEKQGFQLVDWNESFERNADCTSEGGQPGFVPISDRGKMLVICLPAPRKEENK